LGHLLQIRIISIFVMLARVDQCSKGFTSVAYNCNDSGLYYKTMILAKAKLILANFALARSINYVCKVFYELKHAL
jgi:hypothetical protein